MIEARTVCSPGLSGVELVDAEADAVVGVARAESAAAAEHDQSVQGRPEHLGESLDLASGGDLGDGRAQLGVSGRQGRLSRALQSVNRLLQRGGRIPCLSCGISRSIDSLSQVFVRLDVLKIPV